MACSQKFICLDSSQVKVGEKGENIKNDIQKCISQCTASERKRPIFLRRITWTFLDDQNVSLFLLSSYRGTLSEMFEIGRKSLSKAKGNRRLSRKLTESLVRVIILFLVNRLFESEEQIQSDFPQYLAWSKTKDLEDLQEWIES